MRLELGKDALLRSTALVEGNDLARRGVFVGHDDLEFVAIFDGLEQIELKRRFVLAADLFADEDKAVGGTPRLRLLAGLEKAELATQSTPSSPISIEVFRFRQ